jgi:hypothetical protein
MNVNHKGPYTAVELVIEAPWLVSDGHGASLKGGQGPPHLGCIVTPACACSIARSESRRLAALL